EFSQYVHKEERSGTKWEIEIGQAQTDTVTRLINAMFERVIPVDSVNAGTTHASEIRAILEPSVEEFAFVTPRDAGSPYFAVSIKYRVNVYAPDGKLADSWGFTGYGTAQSQGVIMEDPLIQATSLAMRDAGAKLAVEFREQPMVRDLMPGAQPASQTAAAGAAASSEVPQPTVNATPATQNAPSAPQPEQDVPASATADPAPPPQTEPAAPAANSDSATEPQVEQSAPNTPSDSPAATQSEAGQPDSQTR
ncbi:MAG TPA: hypothetical protein VFS47_11910, partial [Steroidobacteraceae bacterium]|nr:hypothetical protein [Steroidobacteraceae bacterium]